MSKDLSGKKFRVLLVPQITKSSKEKNIIGSGYFPPPPSKRYPSYHVFCSVKATDLVKTCRNRKVFFFNESSVEEVIQQSTVS
jgi:hypothetical protein